MATSLGLRSVLLASLLAVLLVMLLVPELSRLILPAARTSQPETQPPLSTSCPAAAECPVCTTPPPVALPAPTPCPTSPECKSPQAVWSGPLPNPAEIDARWPLNLPSDRPEIQRAEYSGVVVTPQLKKLVLARRVMLTTEMDLDTLFGDPRPWTAGQKLNPTGPVGDFTVSYTYKGVAVNVSSTVREIGSRRFLASNILVPANLEDGTIPETSKNFNDALAPFRGKRGLEMGGPTGIFGGIFNIYAAAASVDNMNYASKTLWGGIAERYVVGGRDIGAAYVVDAAHVGERFKDTPYDFVASSNVLEHLANPLSVMKQLVSILKPDGMLVIVVPYKHACFDRLRDYTPFSDLVHHYLKDDKESENLDHMEEWLQLIDMNALDGDRVFVGTLAQLRSRTVQNDARRAIHHHVYHQTTVSHMCAWAGMGTVFQERSGLEMFTICQRRARLPSDVPGFGAGFEPTYY